MPTEAFSVRVDTISVRQLDRIAKQQGRSRNYIVNAAIENFLELHTWQEQRIRSGIEAADKGYFAGRPEMERIFGKYSNA